MPASSLPFPRYPAVIQVSTVRHERFSRGSWTWAFPTGPRNGGAAFPAMIGRRHMPSEAVAWLAGDDR